MPATDFDAHWRASQQRGQIAMTGDDWISDRDKKAHARAEAAHRKACLAAASKLEAAAEAVRAMLIAYLDCGHPDTMGEGDGRRRIAADMAELAAWLRDVHEKN